MQGSFSAQSVSPEKGFRRCDDPNLRHDDAIGRRVCRTFIALFTLALSALLWQTNCVAQFELDAPLTSGRVELPPKTSSGARLRGSGFNASIDLSNQIGAGYIGVVANVNTTAGPSSTTRQLAIRVTPIDRHISADRTIAVDLPFELAQGQTAVTLKRAIPKWSIGNSFRIEVLEDGVPLENYSAELGRTIPGFALRTPSEVLAREQMTDMLFVDVDPVTNVVLPDTFSRFGLPSSSWKSMKSSDLPTDWRVLREIDCITIDAERFFDGSKSTATFKQQYRTIRDWVMMGGTLVLLSVPPDIDLNDASGMSLLQIPKAEDPFYVFVNQEFAAENDRVNWVANYIEEAVVASQGKPGAIINADSMFAADPTFKDSEFVRVTKEWTKNRRDAMPDLRTNWKSGQRYSSGAGQIIALPDEAIDTEVSAAILTKLVSYQRSPTLLRGVDPVMGDVRYRRWLIPGVAEPPVYTFMGILTLFVLLVGPIAYRWTTRGHRSHLMFLIAPALAVITTVAMFSYSIVSDGFGTTIRIRQLTWVDGASGRAAERTRSTMFSGISPRSGLRFSADAEVMAYPAGGQITWRELPRQVSDVRLRTVIDDSEQRFSSAFLPSRSQTQFVSHQIRESLGRIELVDYAALDENGLLTNPDSVDVKNTFPFGIDDLVVRSSDGRYWSIDRLEPGEVGRAERIVKSQDASRKLGDLYTRFNPISLAAQAVRTRRNQAIGDLILYLNREISPGTAVVTDGAFESWLNDYLFVKGDLPQGTFVGISKPSEDVVPVESAERVSSVRYVMGTLP